MLLRVRNATDPIAATDSGREQAPATCAVFRRDETKPIPSEKTTRLERAAFQISGTSAICQIATCIRRPRRAQCAKAPSIGRASGVMLTVAGGAIRPNRGQHQRGKVGPQLAVTCPHYRKYWLGRIGKFWCTTTSYPRGAAKAVGQTHPAWLGYGSTPTDVARYLIFREIEDLKRTGVLQCCPALRRKRQSRGDSGVRCTLVHCLPRDLGSPTWGDAGTMADKPLLTITLGLWP